MTEYHKTALSQPLNFNLVSQVGHSLELGDIVLEVNDIPIRSAEDLQALVAMSDKRIVFLVKKTPEQAGILLKQ